MENKQPIVARGTLPSQEEKKTDMKTLKEYLVKFKTEIMEALPKHLTAERLMRLVMIDIRRNPKLEACTPVSFIGAVLACSQLGLEPGILGYAYLVPYKSECQFILGYKGMLELARRSGNIRRVSARMVREDDYFDYSFGLVERCKHRPSGNLNSKIVGVYGVVEFKDGGHQFEYLTLSEIYDARSKSSSYRYWVTGGKKSEKPIWEVYFEEMVKKTVIRRMFKFLPISTEMQKAVVYDELADIHRQKTALIAEFDSLQALSDETESGELRTASDDLADTLPDF